MMIILNFLFFILVSTAYIGFIFLLPLINDKSKEFLKMRLC